MNISNNNKEFKSTLKGHSAVSRAILKPVYRFGIPNSDPQTLKNARINSCKNRQMTCREQCFEQFRMQNSHSFFLRLHPWTELESLQHPPPSPPSPDPPAAKQFFSSLRLSKNRHPQKNCRIRHWRMGGRGGGGGLGCKLVLVKAY